MKVSIIGTGYVGLVSGTCFAEMDHVVTCIDIDPTKVDMLKKGKSPIYEPGLNEMLERNIKAQRLFFSTDYSSVKDAKTIFIAVGTPSAKNGEANLEYLRQAVIQVAKEISDDAIVVIKSTVPVGTCKMVKNLIAENTKKRFQVVNNPEFLKEGSAIDDFMRPDRVVIGFEQNTKEGEHAAFMMEELYAPLVRQGNPIYRMSNLSAEMTKYAANCFLATKISFINEIARLCDSAGADIEEVRKGITSDRRIGTQFLYPGPGYGGSCFPKDVKALMKTAEDLGRPLSIVKAADDVNNAQKLYMFEKMKKHFSGNLKGKTFAFWGVAFKPNTDDIREAPAIDMAKALVQEGAHVKFYDPVASEHFFAYMKKENVNLECISNKYDCLNNVDGLVVITEWAEFRAPDFLEMKKRLKTPLIFDARNLFQTHKVLELGFQYYAIGKHIG
jgi:UDPglucose 6-dehydrogenase